MYAGLVLVSVGVPLWLGSYAATVAAAVPILSVAVRIIFEERFLGRELPGYAAYTQKVRYRLVPFVW
jgi:protein-S-isoprenylcysteine O-methyltransferase Ste14